MHTNHPMTQAMQSRITDIASEVRRCGGVRAAATSFGSTASGADGGFAVPTDAADAILLPGQNALLPYCRQLPMQSSTIGLPRDMSTDYADSGIVAEWELEAAVLPQRKPDLSMNTYALKKLIVLVPITDELLADSTAMAAYLPDALRNAVTRKVNAAIVSGPGVARPLGILKSSCLVTVAKDGSQAAGSIVNANIEAMLDRALTPLSSVWLANPSAYGRIINLSAWDGGTRTLAGLPVVLTDACSAPGAVGDLLLSDMSNYIAAYKTAQLNHSLHLWYDQDLTAFRLVFRMDGSPVLDKPITPDNASTTKSHFVALAARV